MISPIGVFDSGLGGLTVLKQLNRFLPNEDYIYLGDNARVPYGNKSEETVIKYAKQAARFLLSKDVKMIVVACNTASAFALEELKDMLDIPVIGMIDPAVNAAKNLSSDSVAIIGTVGTIRSGAYKKGLEGSGLSIKETACPLFVPLVESGVGKFEAAATQIATTYLADIKENTPNSLILACTHYPLMRGIIEKILPDVTIIDTGEFAARFISENYSQTISDSQGTSKFYVTDQPNNFIQIAEEDLDIQIKDIEIVKLDEFN